MPFCGEYSSDIHFQSSQYMEKENDIAPSCIRIYFAALDGVKILGAWTSNSSHGIIPGKIYFQSFPIELKVTMKETC